MKVTIKDVAREAGVAVSTVSRVLNDSGSASESTRKFVKEVAEKLGYVPNRAAQSLIKQKTYMVGVLLPDLYGEFYSEIIRSIDKTVQRYAYHVLLSSSNNTRTGIEIAVRAMQGTVDGFVIMFPHENATSFLDVLPEDVPAIILHSAAVGRQFCSLRIDNYLGAYEATRHLIDLGHERIAIIKGEENNLDARERLAGFKAAMQEADLKPVNEYQGSFKQSAGHEAGKEILNTSRRPTAVFASNDSMALGAMSAFREAGLTIPDDISIVGFDNLPTVQYLNPPLTTVNYPISQLGERAINLLMEAVDSDTHLILESEVLPTQLVIRESSAPPRSSTES